jgi:hypothetical protein
VVMCFGLKKWSLLGSGKSVVVQKCVRYELKVVIREVMCKSEDGNRNESVVRVKARMCARAMGLCKLHALLLVVPITPRASPEPLLLALVCATIRRARTLPLACDLGAVQNQ